MGDAVPTVEPSTAELSGAVELLAACRVGAWVVEGAFVVLVGAFVGVVGALVGVVGVLVGVVGALVVVRAGVSTGDMPACRPRTMRFLLVNFGVYERQSAAPVFIWTAACVRMWETAPNMPSEGCTHSL